MTTVLRVFGLVLVAAGCAMAQTRQIVADTPASGHQNFDKERKVAVLIGIGAYPENTGVKKLEYPVADVQELGEALRKVGYVVRTLPDTDATRAGVVRELNTYAKSFRAGEGTFLVYFAGHGFAKNDINYLATYGVGLESLAADGLKESDVRDIMRSSKARQLMLWIDACRDDPETGGTRSVSGPRSFTRLQQAQGLHVLYSTQPGEVSFEDRDKKHGVFTYYLLEGLKGNAAQDGLITFSGLFDYVSVKIAEYGDRTGKRQTPTTAGEASGDFLVSDGEAHTAKAAVTPASPAPVSRAPQPSVPIAEPKSTMVRSAEPRGGERFYDSSHDRDLLPTVQDGQRVLVGRDGQVVLKTSYDFVGVFSEGLSAVRSGGKYGAIDKGGTVILPLQFHSLTLLREGLAGACTESEKCGFLGRDGQWVVPPTFKKVNYFSDGLAKVTYPDGSEWFINRKGGKVQQVAGTANYSSEGKIGAQDGEGKKWGFISHSGRWVIPPDFDEVRPYYRGIAPVKTGGKWLFIDTAGERVATTDAEDFSGAVPLDSLLRAKRRGKWGFMDLSGKWVIQPIYDNVPWGFLDGVAEVTTDEGNGWIDRTGQWITRPAKGPSAPRAAASVTPATKAPVPPPAPAAEGRTPVTQPKVSVAALTSVSLVGPGDQIAGFFVQTGTRAWASQMAGQNFRAVYTETGRDDRSVYLWSNAANATFMLDLGTMTAWRKDNTPNAQPQVLYPLTLPTDRYTGWLVKTITYSQDAGLVWKFTMEPDQRWTWRSNGEAVGGTGPLREVGRGDWKITLGGGTGSSTLEFDLKSWDLFEVTGQTRKNLGGKITSLGR